LQTKADELSEAQKERFRTIQQVLKIHIDGDWDEEMLQAAFENLEKLLHGSGKNIGKESGSKRSRPKSGAAAKRKTQKA